MRKGRPLRAARSPAPAEPDLAVLYRTMLRSRRFEELVASLWRQGLISGEMHLSIGEEAIAAGVVAHCRDGDALALDHRGTAPLLARGLDPWLLLAEFLGREDGLCRGWGGHMHLFARDLLAASSGIVGASGPLGAGFALAARRLRPGSVAAAFFGEGALNQGMLLESFNLAAAWRLPVVFVSRNDEWAIATRSSEVTAVRPAERAAGLGLPVFEADGADVMTVFEAAGKAFEKARNGRGPSFLSVACGRPHGHFLGDLLIRAARHPVRSLRPRFKAILKALTAAEGAGRRERVLALVEFMGLLSRRRRDRAEWRDPLTEARRRPGLSQSVLSSIERGVEAEMEALRTRAASAASAGPGGIAS